MASQIPQIRLNQIRLLSLHYRATQPELVTNSESMVPLDGSVTLSFHAKRKNSFKIRVRQEIKTTGVSFRAIHEARFIAQNPIPQEAFKSRAFQTNVLNTVLPFACELLATLTGKSFAVPVIAPGTLRVEPEMGN